MMMMMMMNIRTFIATAQKKMYLRYKYQPVNVWGISSLLIA
jgi:hypothetical protein